MRIRPGVRQEAITLLAGLAALLLTLSSGVAQTLTLTPAHKDGIYDVGEKVSWRVEVTGPDAANIKQVGYLLRRNGAVTYKEGTLILTNGSAILETSLSEPGAILAEFILPPSPTPTSLPNLNPGKPPFRGIAAGAIVAPTKIRPAVIRPADFDEWWSGKIKMIAAIPPNPKLTQIPGDKPEVDYFTLTLDNINNTKVQAQLAKPKGEGKFPALIILQWAGIYSLPPSRVTDRAMQGWLTLNVQPHDMAVTPDPQQLAQAQQKYANYKNEGNDDREKSYFLRMYLGDYQAVEFITQHPNWDGKTIVLMGTSMGGQQAIVAASLHPKVTALMASVPSGHDLGAALHERSDPFPDWGEQIRTNAAVAKTARYFDAVNFASRINVPAMVAMGLIDETCPPTGIWAGINKMQGPKEQVVMVDSAHQEPKGDGPKTQAPYNNRVNEWLAAIKATGVPPVKLLEEAQAGPATPAQIAQARADMSRITTALKMFEVATGAFPSTGQGLRAMVVQPDGVRGWAGPYLEGFPTDPWGKPYIYIHETVDQLFFKLSSPGPDGKVGTDDDISR